MKSNVIIGVAAHEKNEYDSKTSDDIKLIIAGKPWKADFSVYNQLIEEYMNRPKGRGIIPKKIKITFIA